MPVSADFLQYVLEQLARAGRLKSRRMFGAAGLYCDEVFFAVIDDDTLFFKVGDATRPEYEARGMQPFKPYRDRPEVSMSYYTVPADILDDAEELVAWARRAVAEAAKSPRPTPRKTAAKATRRQAKSRRGATQPAAGHGSAPASARRESAKARRQSGTKPARRAPARPARKSK